MVKKYGSKREKFQVAKQQATDEHRPVQEMEQVMDVELFLEGQARWEEDSPHHLAIIHEMFQHAAAEGWKEAEWIVHQGCQQKLPQLNPEAGLPFIWWDQKPPKKNCRSYTWRFTNFTDFQGLLLGNQHYLKRYCPPSKTAKGRGRKGHLQPQSGPIQKPPIPWEVEPPEGKKGQLGGEESGHHTSGPPKSAGHSSYPQRRNRKIKLHPEPPGSEGEIQEQGLLGM